MPSYKKGGGNKEQPYNAETGEYQSINGGTKQNRELRQQAIQKIQKNHTDSKRLELYKKAKENYGYSKKHYNLFGWARANVLNYEQYKSFEHKFSQAKYKQWNPDILPSGEFFIPVGDMHGEREGVNNFVVYAKGTIKEPNITCVVKIDLDNETDLSAARTELLIYENTISNDRRTVQKEVGELFAFYHKADYEV